MTGRSRRATTARSVVLAVASLASIAAAAPSGNVTPTLDPVPAGEVGVVAASAPVDGRIAVVVQNGTTRAVRNVRVTALATRADGGRATRAVTRDVMPSTLGPGEIALGVVEFRRRDVRAGSVMTFEATSGRAPSTDDPAVLDVGSFELSAPLEGKVAQTLDLTVSNPGSRTVNGPIALRVMCFNEAGRPALAVDGAVKTAKLRAGGNARATVRMRELCPSYLVAAQGKPAPSRGAP
jgi:hypothetical protein